MKSLLRGLVFIGYLIVGLLSIVATWQGLIDTIGFGLTILSILVFPITFFVYPLYAGFFQGDWFLIYLNYGGVGILTFLIYLLKD